MTDLGMPLNPSQLAQANAQLDRSQCGQVSFGEVLAVVERLSLKPCSTGVVRRQLCSSN